MSWLHPRWAVHAFELKKALELQARLQRQGLPIPGWLSEKIAKLQGQLQ